MKKTKWSSLIRIPLLLALALAFVPSHAEIAIIANPGNSLHGISMKEIRDIYLGKSRSFSNGERVNAVDQPASSEIRKAFSKNVLNMSVREFNRYISKRKFSGKVRAPKVIDGDIAVRQWVANTPSGLGYINGKSVNSSVKVLLIIP
ncbi:MAG TPA: phosphate ABC transporter substrate-binding protein [Gammaproteobacteria bacterium]|nr:phosphate ABC transporter substrate-binding protein [Gammaproteobacteria bacterium]